MAKKSNGAILDVAVDNTNKRKPKSKPEFDIQLNEEQKEAKRIILENDIVVLFGKPGSGKCLHRDTLIDIEIDYDFYNFLVKEGYM